MDSFRIPRTTCLFALLFLLTTGLCVSASAETFSPTSVLTGMVGAHEFHEDQDLSTGLSLGGAFGYRFQPRWIGEVMFHLIQSEHDDTEVDTNGVHVSLNGLYLFRPETGLRPYLAGGAGVLGVDPEGMDSDQAFALNLGGGLFFDLCEHAALRLDARFLFPPEDQEYNLAAHAGISWIIGSVKPAVAPMPSPTAVADHDGDGVTDPVDSCPDTPAGIPVDTSGCPLDSDGDGVTDPMDTCPATPAGVPVDAMGCALDTDMDGVPDHQDWCPGTAENTEVDDKGCAIPQPADTDGDGVTDDMDRCPDTPAMATVNASGCWELQGLRFETGSAAIRKEGSRVLADVARVLAANPELAVEIGGHTDNTGSARYNRNLSEKRAMTVRDFFIEKGIASHRLTVKGYGPDQPVADNATREGRFRNRRVELTPIR